MKSPITWLPTLALLGLIALVAQDPALQSTPAGRDCGAEVQSLAQQLRLVSQRLEWQRGEHHHVVPRGGLSGSTSATPAGSAPRC